MPKTADPLTSKDGKKLKSLYQDMWKQIESSWATINKEGLAMQTAIRRYHAFRDAADDGQAIHEVLHNKYGKSKSSLAKKWNKVHPVITTGKGEINL